MVNFLAAERTAFSGMRVEAGHRQAGIGDPEVSLKSAQSRSAASFDQRGAQPPRDFGQGQMRGHRHGAKRRPGKHHDDVVRGNAAALGNEFGLPRVAETDSIKLLLADGSGDHGRHRAGPRETNRQLEAVERTMGSGDRGAAGNAAFGSRNCEQREAIIERGIDVSRIVYYRKFAVPDLGEGSRIPDRNERWEAQPVAGIPAFGNDLGTDPGGIAKRDRDGKKRRGKNHRLPLSRGP